MEILATNQLSDSISASTHGWFHPKFQAVVLTMAFAAHYAQAWHLGQIYNYVFKGFAISSTVFITIINFEKASKIVYYWFNRIFKRKQK